MAWSGSRLLDRPERLAWLRLIRTDNVGPRTFRQLLHREGSAEAAIEALPSLTRRLGFTPRVPPASEAEAELAALEAMGARLIAACEPDYPALLRHAAGAPPLLSILGGVGADTHRTIGLVGARNASTAGQKLTRVLARELGAAGYLIVSGLARGIDAAAHAASLETGTIAVLAGGLDCIYPEENLPLAEAIVANGGALVTEMPLGWSPRARDFPRRNRLVAGMSRGIVVVEAAKRSGSLITARMALEQDREVFAVPGSPLDPRAEGGNALIQQGARLVTCAADIIDVLREAEPRRWDVPEVNWEAPLSIGEDDTPPGEAERDRLLAALSVTPVAVDELIAATALSASSLQTLLLGLDLEGRIEWSSGQLVALKS
ncbi:MAG TPA: DNA-processing protein DprA [Devosiaceae bacterium]|jgi:DNA processing protein|nr:DNA-processing protein DprA [Devosiaceae bacterium]